MIKFQPCRAPAAAINTTGPPSPDGSLIALTTHFDGVVVDLVANPKGRHTRRYWFLSVSRTLVRRSWDE